MISERYRLEEKIGSGGMSSVYRAFDPTLERWVAIKLMHRDISTDPDQLERFRREARAVAQLNHPHVVTVIDAGEDDGTPYIVFEYVEGETLKDRIRRIGPPAGVRGGGLRDRDRPRALVRPRARLVHRDVKPQNVLIDRDGRAKVTDFGIARSLEAEGLTATGRVLGTTDYVSPEQALGHEVTEQSDIYSLGIVLYEMLTGEPPFKADTQVAVAMKHVGSRCRTCSAGARRSRPRSPPWWSAPPPRRRRTATPRRTRWCTTSRRCWRSRRRARARRPARPRRCCARCPATPRTSRRGGCATRGGAALLTVLVLALLCGRRDRLRRHPHREGRRRHGRDASRPG